MHKGFTCDKCETDLSPPEISSTFVGRFDGSYVAPRNQLHFTKVVQGRGRPDEFDEEHEAVLDLCDSCMADQLGALGVELVAPPPRKLRLKKARSKS